MGQIQKLGNRKQDLMEMPVRKVDQSFMEEERSFEVFLRKPFRDYMEKLALCWWEEDEDYLRSSVSWSQWHWILYQSCEFRVINGDNEWYAHRSEVCYIIMGCYCLAVWGRAALCFVGKGKYMRAACLHLCPPGCCEFCGAVFFPLFCGT